MIDLSLEQLYLYMGLFATVLFILKIILYMFVGGDFEVESSFNTIDDTDISFNFLSVQSILAFFMSFSWTGLTTLTKFNSSLIVSIVVSILVGLIFMFVTAYLLFIIKKLDHKTGADIRNSIGAEGKAYTEFEPMSNGQVEIVVNNKLVIVDAISLSEEKIDAFAKIRVEKVENNKLYINKI